MHEQPNKLSSDCRSKHYATPDYADEDDCSQTSDGQPNALAQATHARKAENVVTSPFDRHLKLGLGICGCQIESSTQCVPGPMLL